MSQESKEMEGREEGVVVDMHIPSPGRLVACVRVSTYEEGSGGGSRGQPLENF